MAISVKGYISLLSKSEGKEAGKRTRRLCSPWVWGWSLTLQRSPATLCANPRFRFQQEDNIAYSTYTNYTGVVVILKETQGSFPCKKEESILVIYLVSRDVQLLIEGSKSPFSAQVRAFKTQQTWAWSSWFWPAFFKQQPQTMVSQKPRY